MKSTMSLVSVVMAGLMLACGKREAVVTAEKVPPVEGVLIETVRTAPVTDYYEAVGTVRSKTSSVLSSKIVGQVIAVQVREGDRVRAGQRLIDISNRESDAQLRKAQAGVREAQHGLEEVEQGMRAAESAQAAAEAQKALATSTFQRYQALLERRSVSPQEFEDVQAKYKTAVAEVNRATEMRASLSAKKDQMLARMDQAKADVAAAEVYTGYARILSPIAGVVTAKAVEVGMLAAPGLPLLTVEDLAHYRLEAAVEESRIGKIRFGDPARVRIDALGAEDLTGRVAEIVPASDPASRSYTVKIDLAMDIEPNGASSLLRSGLFGRARFAIDQKAAITIPQKAVLWRGQLLAVYVVDTSGTARLRLIKTGKPYGERVEVLAGLNDKERIIVHGLDAVRDGRPVKLSGEQP